MRLEWLGDALDHWKGSLLEFLQKAGHLDDFAVDPMATDFDDWHDADYRIYADLLRVDPARIVRHAVSIEDRNRYFAELPPVQDVFFDPDTGVATGRVKRMGQYLRSEDIWRWFYGGTDRMAIVYQHVRAKKTIDRVDEVISRLAGSDSMSWCSYESGTVAMLFLSLAAHRIRAAETVFLAKLGHHGPTRVRSGYPSDAI